MNAASWTPPSSHWPRSGHVPSRTARPTPQMHESWWRSFWNIPTAPSLLKCGTWWAPCAQLCPQRSSPWTRPCWARGFWTKCDPRPAGWDAEAVTPQTTQCWGLRHARFFWGTADATSKWFQRVQEGIQPPRSMCEGQWRLTWVSPHTPAVLMEEDSVQQGPHLSVSPRGTLLGKQAWHPITPSRCSPLPPTAPSLFLLPNSASVNPWVQASDTLTPPSLDPRVLQHFQASTGPASPC